MSNHVCDIECAFHIELAIQRERDGIIKLLSNHEWFEQGEKDDVLAILDGSYECECDGCIAFMKGNKNA